jgi:hypothetical protein
VIESSPACTTCCLQDLPDAEMPRLHAGHIAVENHLDYIAGRTIRFYNDRALGLME